MPGYMRHRVPEESDPELRAKALEALRLRLDTQRTWPTQRSWPAIAQTLGYPTGDEAKRAAWRTFNRIAYRQWPALFTQFLLLAEATGLPASERQIRDTLRELDTQKVPEDRDPPKPKAPKKPRKPSKAAIKRAIREEIERRRNTVEASPDPHAVTVHTDAHRDTRRDIGETAQ